MVYFTWKSYKISKVLSSNVTIALYMCINTGLAKVQYNLDRKTAKYKLTLEKTNINF